MSGPLASLWRRLRRQTDDRADIASGTGSPGEVESGAGHSRGESDLAGLRSELGAVEARLAELVAANRSAVESSLEGLAASFGGALASASEGSRAQVQQSAAALAGQIEQLDRERFEELTLLEGQGAALDRLAEQAEGLERHLDAETAELRRALADVGRRQEALLAELRERERLRVISELFPVADGLVESRRAAERLVASLGDASTMPTRLAVPRESPLVALAARLFGGEPSESPAPQVQTAALGPALEAWLEGLRLLERRLLGAFAREGVEPIPAIGERFDPRYHLAVAVEAVAVERAGSSSDVATRPNVVVREERRGYRAGDRVLRPAEVVVGVADRAAAEQVADASPDGSHFEGEKP